MSETTPRPDQTPGDPTTAGPADAVPGAQAPPPPPPAEYGAQPYPPSYPQSFPRPDPGSQAYAQQLPPGSPGPGTAVAPPAAMSPETERTWGMGAHGVALAATVLSGGFLGFVAALAMYLGLRDRGPFVRHHTANALNVQIIAGIVMLVSLPLMLLLIGFVTFAAAWLFAVIAHIIGMVRANKGEWWNPPLTPHFVK